MSNLEGLGLQFDESMSGWLGVGLTDYVEGRDRGEQDGSFLRVDLTVMVPDLARFLNISDHTAHLVGTISFAPLGGKFTIRDGLFNLFSVDPEENVRHMTYSFRFTADDGKTYFLKGFKRIKDDPGALDVVSDMTTLFTKIYAGGDDSAPVYGAGQISFKLMDTPAFMASMRVTGQAWFWQKVAAKVAFCSFAFGVLREEYLRDLNPMYDTEYENLVLSGEARDPSGAATNFFMVSGVHDKDFPWGDGEIFWDVMLVLGDKDSGYRRFCITDRVLQGLRLDVERGLYTYKGPLYEILKGYSTSFKALRKPDANLKLWTAEIEIRFTATQYDTTPLPFLVADQLISELSTDLKWALRKVLPSEHILGTYITPHTVVVKQGKITLTQPADTLALTMDTVKTFGEAERSTFRNLKEPTLLYGYICAIRPEDHAARVQIHASSLRNERQFWLKDQLDAFIGVIVSHLVEKEMLMENGKIKVNDVAYRPEDPADWSAPFVKEGRPILEVNNDHFPTAVFQRRIIEVLDPSGEDCLALEEAMDTLKLDPIKSSRTDVPVAAIKADDKFEALKKTLAETTFIDTLNKKWEGSGLAKEDFSVVIKANFMFAYNVADKSTFTDPELVERLVEIIKAEGYPKITVVEAQSTYGEYFTKRSVREVAEYLGYSVDRSKGYDLVDLTLDAYDEEHLGPHLGLARVPKTWKDAKFRISFAKNKTHAYAFYTLTLKNIYGALPLANKFKEYHCDRDIYYTTMEYLRAFPVDFGLIDAYLSADGPFGIFADSEPNPTKTIIGGPDLVAVDWVGASKMGLDPMVSKYMRLAVDAFGKPGIKFIGDRGLYHPWLNVPVALTLFTSYGLDSNYYFGNLFYLTGCYMDEAQFEFKDKSAFLAAARLVVSPLQKAVFLQTGGKRTRLNLAFSKFLTWLGSQ